jgi:hypothetical protein
VSSDKGSHRLPVAFETQTDFKVVGHELEVRRLLQGDEFPEECDGFRRPVRPMVTPGKLGGELGVFPEKAGAEPVKMGAADLEVVGGISGINSSLIELTEDLLEEEVGGAICDLLFL